MSRRLVAIVLHGGGPYYLKPLLAAGRVPALARLMASGSSRTLLSPYPISASAWVTMLTGQPVAAHGIIDYMQVDARSYHAATAERVDASGYQDRTIFAVLTGAGRRVASIYLPMTHPPFPVNGIMISGFPLPDEQWPPTWPPELSRAIGPLNQRKLSSLRYERSDEVRAYLDFHLDRVEHVAEEACRDRQYDLVLACLALPDLAHHYFWNGNTPEALEPIYKVYERVDAAIGRLMDAAAPEDYFSVFSDHGGGPAPTRLFTVNRWLQEAGYQTPAAPALQRLGAVNLVNGAIRAARRLRINQRLAPYLGGRVRAGVSAITQNDAFVDWDRTRAYGMNFFYPLVGIELNLRGRQPRGIVEPGAEYDRLRSELMERLASLEDPATGQRICREVRRGAEMFAGPHADRFPDIVGILDRDYDSRTQIADAVFEPNQLQWEYPYMGYHDSEGTFAIRGPGVAAGATMDAVHMIDIAPTLLHLVGVPQAPWMEGRPFPI
jgi:predicted AlkP superfamily phosphohydrolase/phosphomutase